MSPAARWEHFFLDEKLNVLKEHILVLIKWSMFALACAVCSQELKFNMNPQL